MNKDGIKIKRKINGGLIGILALAVLILAIPGTADGGNDPFEGITNPKVLPLLKHLPYDHGGMNVPASDGRLLYDLVKKKGYKRGLELGTSNGYSALWLGLAFKENNGALVTLEIHPKRAAEARQNFKKAGLDKIIECRTGDALKEIPKLQGEFDFIFIDAWKEDYMNYLKMLKPRVTPGGAITAHNVRSHQRSMQDFLKAIKTDPTLETVIHHSSYSGVSVSIKKTK
jgi:predicted O-methyltransferase YrrM